MLDLLISGAQVVTPTEVAELDVAVAGGRIVGLGTPGTFEQGAARTIDARGKLLVPGAIDPHVHTMNPVPFQGIDGTSADPTQVSRAGAYGGTTTIIDFSLVHPGLSIAQAIQNKEQYWKGKAYTDYTYHTMLMGAVTQEVIDQLPEAVSAGYPTVKIFTTDIRPGRGGRMVPFGRILPIAQKLAQVGGLLVVHAEDNDLVMAKYEELNREGRTGWEYMPVVHSTLSEELAVRRMLKLAEHEGVGVYFVHLSAGSAVEAVAEARARNKPVYGETLHHYACFTADFYKRPDGALIHTYPSLKYEEDRQRIWQGLSGTDLSTVATDEVCTTRAVKLQGHTINDTTGGHVGVETRLSIMYTEAVSKRGLSLQRFVDLVSANAARIHGMYPRKGAIAIGSDADLVVLDPSVRRVLRAEDLHESDYTPWEGWEVHAWPSATVLRGKVVMENGQLLGTPGDGQLVPRKIASSIISRPAA